MAADLQAPINTPVLVSTKIIGWLSDFTESGAKVLLVAEAPFFGWPVISQITDFYIKKIGDLLSDYLKQYDTFLIIDEQTQAENDAYRRAVEVLRSNLNNEAAQKDFDDYFKNLIKFGSS